MEAFANLNKFLKSYWHHAKTIFDGILLFVALAAVFFGKDIRFIGWVGWVVLIVIIILAAERTWLHEHEHSSKLLKSLTALKDDNISLDKLTEMQKDIIDTLNKSEEKIIVIFSPRAGTVEPIFYGLEDMLNRYNPDELRTEIEDLAEKQVIKISGYAGMHKEPIFKPTKLFYQIVKEEKQNDDAK